MATFDLYSYARHGAEARLAELQIELEAIYGAFPDLRGGRRGRPTRAMSLTTDRPGRGSQVGNGELSLLPVAASRCPPRRSEPSACG